MRRVVKPLVLLLAVACGGDSNTPAAGGGRGGPGGGGPPTLNVETSAAFLETAMRDLGVTRAAA